jgi:hypothetical protein
MSPGNLRDTPSPRLKQAHITIDPSPRNAPEQDQSCYSPSNPVALPDTLVSHVLIAFKKRWFQIFPASLCSTASYVDIRAKTDVYVGFLPSQSLERLLERQPIVLLTLAKRLISMLSPFRESPHPHYTSVGNISFQFCTSMPHWSGCMSMLGKFFGDHKMKAIVFIS